MAGFRTKYEPPEIEEALVAAEGLTDDKEQQLDIAAALMGVSRDEVGAWRKQHKPANGSRTLILGGARKSGSRSAPEVVVLKRRPRAA